MNDKYELQFRSMNCDLYTPEADSSLMKMPKALKLLSLFSYLCVLNSSGIKEFHGKRKASVRHGR